MAAQNNDDDVQFIQQNPIQMGDVVDLLGDDDFDEVFNVDDLSSPTSNSNNNTSIDGGSLSSNSMVKAEVVTTTTTTTTNSTNNAVTVNKSPQNITGGKRKADSRSPPPAQMVSPNQTAKKKTKTSNDNNDSSNNNNSIVTDLTNLPEDDDEEEVREAAKNTPSKQGRTNTILKRIGISDIDKFEAGQRRSNRIEKLRIVRDSERAKEQLLKELANMRGELARSDRVQMNLFRKVDSMEQKASTAIENAMTLKQEKRSLEKTLARKEDDLKKKIAEINKMKDAIKAAEKKATSAVTASAKKQKKDDANLVEKKLLTQAREETKKAKSLCVSLEKKITALDKKANTLTKSLANSASTRKKSIEEYKAKLTAKEKELKAAKAESKNLLDEATDSATEMLANLQQEIDTSKKQLTKLKLTGEALLLKQFT